MAMSFLHITKRKQRLQRENHVRFLVQLLVMVEAGYELNFAWKRSFGPFDSLEEAMREHPEKAMRPWYALLFQTYRSGAPVAYAISAILTVVRQEQNEDWQEYVRGLAPRTNVGLLFVIVPPLLLLLFFPLFLGLSAAFSN